MNRKDVIDGYVIHPYDCVCLDCRSKKHNVVCKKNKESKG